MRATLEFLASFRLRLLFRGAFLLLALAVLTMAIVMLYEAKQRAYRRLSKQPGQDPAPDHRPAAPPGGPARPAQPAHPRRRAYCAP